MVRSSRKHAASNSWSDGHLAKRLHTSAMLTLDTLPFDILERVLGYTGSFNLIWTCRALHMKLHELRGRLVIALLPLTSTESLGQEDLLFSRLTKRRAHDPAESIAFQKQVMQSAWFHPRQIRYLLPQLLRIALQELVSAQDVEALMKEIRQRGEDPLNVEGELLQPDPSDMGCLQLRLKSPFSISWQRDEVIQHFNPTAFLWHLPPSLLQPPFSEEDVQLLWMCRRLLLETGPSQGDIYSAASVDGKLLVKAIESAILACNPDAVRELLLIRHFLQNWGKCRLPSADYCLVEPEWFLLAAKADNCFMVNCLAEFDQWSMPYWDRAFVAWSQDRTRYRDHHYVLAVGEWAANLDYKTLEGVRLASGHWPRQQGPETETVFRMGLFHWASYEEWTRYREDLNSCRYRRGYEPEVVAAPSFAHTQPMTGDLLVR